MPAPSDDELQAFVRASNLELARLFYAKAKRALGEFGTDADRQATMKMLAPLYVRMAADDGQAAAEGERAALLRVLRDEDDDSPEDELLQGA